MVIDRSSWLFCLFVLPLFLFQCAQSPDEEPSELGVISFTPTGDTKAQPYFEKGLLLLHSFEYQDAATAFHKAREIDPAFVMAYWGEAMTKNHPLWAAQYTDDATEILNALAPTKEERLALAATPIERDFLEGVEILYGEGEKLERDKRYAAHMEHMHSKYPDSQEVTAFYALSVLGSVVERDDATYGKAARIAAEVLKQNPNHPGALHYTIHSYDDPAHAYLALNVANSYAKVAPDAAHALHMPSHIYVALGMWDEVISSNIASWDASNVRRERLKLDNDARSYHALHWLMYGYLQKGEVDRAAQLVADMVRYADEKPSDRARAYVTYMRAGYLVDSETWDETLARMEVDDDDLNISIRSINDFISGMQAYRNENVQQLTRVISQMNDDRIEEEKRMIQRGAAMCSGVSWAQQLPSEQDINHAHVMEMELKALLATLEGKDQQAEMWFNEAITLEENTSFTFGPPAIVKPSYELYAEWLSKRDPEQAMDYFEKTLERAPKRRIAMNGKASLTAI